MKKISIILPLVLCIISCNTAIKKGDIETRKTYNPIWDFNRKDIHSIEMYDGEVEGIHYSTQNPKEIDLLYGYSCQTGQSGLHFLATGYLLSVRFRNKNGDTVGTGDIWNYGPLVSINSADGDIGVLCKNKNFGDYCVSLLLKKNSSWGKKVLEAAKKEHQKHLDIILESYPMLKKNK